MDRGDASLEFRHADRLSLGSLSLVLDMTMKKSVGLPCKNWSGAEAALLMSPRQDETSQHKGIKCGVAGWVPRKCLCETAAARAALLRERVGHDKWYQSGIEVLQQHGVVFCRSWWPKVYLSRSCTVTNEAVVLEATMRTHVRHGRSSISHKVPVAV